MSRKAFLIGRITAICLFLSLFGSLSFAEAESKEIKALYSKHRVYKYESDLVAFGPRVAGGDVEKAAADHIANEMKRIGLDVEIQEFEMEYFEEITPPLLEQVTPDPIPYEGGSDFVTMGYSGSGDVSAVVQAVDLDLPPSGNSTSGCEEEDFDGFVSGNIALIQRGTCSFAQKAQNAEAAGATGVLIFNEGNTPERTEVIMGTLGDPGITIPVMGITFALGETLAQGIEIEETLVTMRVDALSELRTSQNVIGTLAAKQPAQGIVYIGAHYDSVAAGPGANDNASGVAAVLEAAKVAKIKRHCIPSTLKFIAFGAEETGLDGSYNYVEANYDEVSSMGLGMINLDMIAVGEILQIGNIAYSDGGGSQLTEYTQEKATAMGMPWEAFEAGENSDHTYFEQAGVSAVFITQREDPNYHTAEDTLDKIQFDTLEDNGELATATLIDWAINAPVTSTEVPVFIQSKGAQLEKRHVYEDKLYDVE